MNREKLEKLYDKQMKLLVQKLFKDSKEKKPHTQQRWGELSGPEWLDRMTLDERMLEQQELYRYDTGPF